MAMEDQYKSIESPAEGLFKDKGDSDGDGKRSLPKGWEVPEGAEAFGHARHDLDWIDPTRR